MQRNASMLHLTVALVSLVASLIPVKYAQASFEKEEAEIQALLGENKFETAASYIYDHKGLLTEPRFVRLYTHILTTKYLQTINYSIFALKDLEAGERVEDLRGKKGTFQIVSGALDEFLYERIKDNPDSAEINFAVGEYLSRGAACGCRAPGPLKDLSGEDGVYFIKAYEAGVFDEWSLFRIGVYQHAKGKLDKAIVFYKKASEADPNNADAIYNLAAAYYQKRDLGLARKYAEQTLGKYEDKKLSADAYAMHGLILVGLGDDLAAERSLEKALNLNIGHSNAFFDLLGVYRRTKQNDKYIKRVLDFIALDYSNTYTFNIYINYLSGNEPDELDGEIEKRLLKLELKDTKQIGALYFNLARVADVRKDNAAAIKRYRRSLEAIKSLEKAPPGAIKSITNRINELNERVVND
jgi:tetratricopeptide (TPR) repeat protein